MIQLLRRQFGICALLVVCTLGMAAASARADITISDPANGAVVRGEITVHFTGVPDGGYAIIKVDGNFVQATAQSSFDINTFAPDSFGGGSGANTDGAHQVSITGVDASGKQTSTASVTFNVSNNQVDVNSPAILLTHWVPADRLDQDAQRYRVFAVSDGPAQGTGTNDINPDELEAPLDFQYSMLLRRVVRDVGLFDDAANIKTVVQEAFQRQREKSLEFNKDDPGGATSFLDAEQAGINSELRRQKEKQDWAPNWQLAPETGQYSVRAIKEDGDEINGTRKQNMSVIASLFPVFPAYPVQPGSRWESMMTFITNIPALTPMTVNAPMVFTKFEDITLPSGQVRHAAKLESRFKVDSEQNSGEVKRVAAMLAILNDSKIKVMEEEQISKEEQDQIDKVEKDAKTKKTSTEQVLKAIKAIEAIRASFEHPVVMGPRMVIPDDMIEKTIPYIDTVDMNCSRVIWFDPQWHCILRMQDSMTIGFDYKIQATVSTDNIASNPTPNSTDPGAQQGSPVTSVTEKGLNYTMRVTTWYDDSVPAPTDKYNGGAGTAHSKDNVQELSLTKVTGNP